MEYKEKQLTFRGHPYRIAFLDSTPQHPTWFTFDDEEAIRNRHWDIAPGDYVFDIGAAYGSYTLTALACGAAYAWSWAPEGFGEATEADVLRASLQLNGWSRRCSIYTYGLYSKAGFINTETQEFSKVSVPGRAWIRVVPLDEMALIGGGTKSTHLKMKVWMKLDVEGAEVHVLQGAKETIKRYRPKLLIENHLFVKRTLEQDVRDLLLSWDYREVATHPYHSVSHSFYEPKPLP